MSRARGTGRDARWTFGDALLSAQAEHDPAAVAVPAARITGDAAHGCPTDGRPKRGLGLQAQEVRWTLPVAAADVLEARGTVIGRPDAGSAMVSYRDFVACVRREGGDAWVVPVKLGAKGDAGLDLPALARLGGYEWLAQDEIEARSTPGGRGEDPVLLDRMRDLMTAVGAGEGTSLVVTRPRGSGTKANAWFEPWEDSTRSTFLHDAGTHAAVVAGDAEAWCLPPGGHPSLSTSWCKGKVVLEVTGGSTGSRILDAARAAGAPGRTLDWLGATGAPAAVVRYARRLVGARVAA